MLVLLAIIAGVGGGLLTNLFDEHALLFAEQPAEAHHVLVSQEFRLVDKQGVVRATLAMSAEGPGLVLYDSSGRPHALFTLTGQQETPVLSLMDGQGKHRATMAIKTNGEPYLSLRDNRGRNRIALLVDHAGEAAMTIYDGSGRERAILGNTDLTRIRRTGFIEQKALPALILLDKSGQVLWRAP